MRQGQRGEGREGWRREQNGHASKAGPQGEQTGKGAQRPPLGPATCPAPAHPPRLIPTITISHVVRDLGPAQNHVNPEHHSQVQIWVQNIFTICFKRGIELRRKRDGKEQ